MSAQWSVFVALFIWLGLAVTTVELTGAPGEEVWNFQSAGAIVGGPARGSDGTLYVGSRDNGVYAVDAEGRQRWRFAAQDWVDAAPTLSFDEATVYVGSWDNRVYAIASDSGVLRWEFATENLVTASVALDGAGNLFFGSTDGYFYSLDPDGGLRWKYFLAAEIDAAAAVARDGSVYVGAGDGAVYSFSNDGKLLWQYATRETVNEEDQRILSPIAIDADDRLYFGAGDAHFYALSAAGELLWDFETGGKVDTGAAISEAGDLYFASRDGFLYILDDSGVLREQVFVGDVFLSSPAVDSEGTAYVGAFLGDGVSSMTAVSATGEVQWEFAFFDFVDSSPLIDGAGRVIFGSHDGALYAVEAGVMPAVSAWNRFGGDESNRSQQINLGARLPERVVRWQQVFAKAAKGSLLCEDADGDGLSLAVEYAWGLGLGTDASLWNVQRSDTGRLYVDYLEVLGDEGFERALEVRMPDGSWKSVDGLPDWESVLLDADVFADGWYERRRLYFSDTFDDTPLLRLGAACE